VGQLPYINTLFILLNWPISLD